MSPSIQRLIEALRCLPGVGSKSAQRMVMHLLEYDRAGGAQLAAALTDCLANVRHCHRCRNYAESELCDICVSLRRDASLLCVVETPADVLALEHSGSYNGRYFVLMGHLSPLDGIGPEELGVEQLQAQVGEAGVREVILALNATVEGEATSHFVAECLAPLGVTISRIAHGVPFGGELEYVDGGTLSRALAGRQRFERT
ncbi:MAG: recombination mediator RecR [Pseudomonadota bacterium]|nr:recombination mediator RecR [Pseudomonadota bacterium]